MDRKGGAVMVKLGGGMRPAEEEAGGARLDEEGRAEERWAESGRGNEGGRSSSSSSSKVSLVLGATEEDEPPPRYEGTACEAGRRREGRANGMTGSWSRVRGRV